MSQRTWSQQYALNPTTTLSSTDLTIISRNGGSSYSSYGLTIQNFGHAISAFLQNVSVGALSSQPAYSLVGNATGSVVPPSSIGLGSLLSLSTGYLNLAPIAANTLFGNPTGSSATPSVITLGTNLSFSGSVLNSAGITNVILNNDSGFIGVVESPGANTSFTLKSLQGTNGVTATDNTTNIAFSLSTQAATTILANATGSSAVPTAVTLGSGLSFTSGSLNVANLAATSLLGNSAASATTPSAITLGSGLAFSGSSLTISSVPLTSLATQAANTILANATASTAVPTAVAVSASSLVGRAPTGNITNISVGTGLSFSGSTLNVSAASLGAIVNINIQTITASGTYTPTAGAIYSLVYCIGAGAGGSASNSVSLGSSSAGGGGGSGGVSVGLFNTLTVSGTSITIGAAGTGGSSAGSQGNPGGTTYFGPTGFPFLSAQGGAQPPAAVTNGAVIGGGNASTFTGSQSYFTAGSAGGMGYSISGGAAWGGFGAGNPFAGQTTVALAPSAGGAASQVNGTGYGGGGAGGAFNGSAGSGFGVGGNGRGGAIIIYEYIS